MTEKLKTEVKELPEGITQAMIDEAKLKHGADKVKFIDLPVDEESTSYKTLMRYW